MSSKTPTFRERINPRKLKENFLAGGLAGFLTTVFAYPIDGSTASIRGKVKKERVTQALKNIVHDEGFSGLYKGIVPTVISTVLVRGMRFASYDLSKRYLFGTVKEKELPVHQIAISGAIAGIFTALVSTPPTVVKLNTQKKAGSEPNTHSSDVAKGTVKRRGIQGLFRGIGPSLMRDIPSCAVLFSSYEFIRRKMKEAGYRNEVATSVAGGISTYISLIFGYPSDLIAKDIQLSPKDKDATVEAEKKMKYEGIKGFYKGISKAFAKNVIVGAATFLIYECAVSFLAGAQVL